MKDDEIEVRNDNPVIRFQDPFVNIQLHRVVPIVRIRQMFQRSQTRSKGIVRFDLFGALPVIDDKCSVGFATKHHINGSAEFNLFFVRHRNDGIGKDLPFAAIRFQIVSTVRPEFHKVFPFYRLQDGGMDLFRSAMEELFNGQVHRRSRLGCDLSILRPFCHDLFVRAPDVFAGGPIRTLAHFGENRFPIKMPKEFVNKSRA